MLRPGQAASSSEARLHSQNGKLASTQLSPALIGCLAWRLIKICDKLQPSTLCQAPIGGPFNMGVTHHLEPLITTVQTNLQTCKIYMLMHFRGGALSSKKLDLQIKDQYSNTHLNMLCTIMTFVKRLVPLVSYE